MFPLLLLGALFSIPDSVLSYGNLGNTPVRGVNLGGWLILEKWMTPKVFEGLPESVDDEYKLCKHLGKTESKKRLESHWKTWVTEQDIINYKNAGLNHVRLPIGYWAYDIKSGEPWVSGSLDYAKKAIGWCKKHGLKVMFDLHGLPGSQNGNDHSGQSGAIDFFYDADNLKRATNIVRQIAQWASSSEWKDTVTIIQVANEPILWGNDYNFRLNKLKEYYRMAYDAVREKSQDTVVAVHDAFIDYKNWYYLGEDSHNRWVMLDTHIYQVFGDEYKNMTCAQHEKAACKYKSKLQESNKKLWTVVGEWSLSTPIKCTNKVAMGKNQVGVYEQATGWFFWAHKNGQGWQDWSFEDSYKNGWINPKVKNVDSC